ncbi:FlgO family outer membrane protein [uncultured Ferrimonas sp.]|uniref:FlgO family outer membrane protein n=1 Tax=uncultured Ferrimonas sp. TaxID=432640 RepID=UPI002630BB36|nr:FlgO family outer membrane protein [uncultured Ferrimonas sp.]
MRWAIWVLLAMLAGCAQQDKVNVYYFDDAERGKSLPPQGPLNHLANQIADDLVIHHNMPIGRQVLAVTTPVPLTDFSNSSEFGLQLGDALMSSLHQRGFNLVDLNGSDVVRVSRQGNLLLSRDVQQLSNSIQADQVLVATIGHTTDGVQIYTRMLTLSNNRVVSTSQTSVAWQQLPNHFKPSRQVSLERGKLFRHAESGKGQVVEWNQ